MRHWVDPIPDLKRQIADELLRLTDGWTQNQAAWFMHISQARVSDLRRGNLATMSLERLLQCLHHFGRGIEVRTAQSVIVSRRMQSQTLRPNDPK